MNSFQASPAVRPFFLAISPGNWLGCGLTRWMFKEK